MVEPSPKGHTLLLQASTANSRLRVPQQIQWKDINLPEQWKLQAIALTPKIENTEPDFIAQQTDGTVIIAFNNNDRHTNSLIRASNSLGSKVHHLIFHTCTHIFIYYLFLISIHP